MQSPYAQLLAATTLTKLVTRPNLTLPLEQRIDIRKFILNCWVELFWFFFCIANFHNVQGILMIYCFAGNYVLNYMATRPKLVHYVLQGLVQVSDYFACYRRRQRYSYSIFYSLHVIFFSSSSIQSLCFMFCNHYLLY